jgi:hypothetical protein
MAAAMTAEDPRARLLPHLLTAGTDAKSFQRLGIRNLGFAPLKPAAELGLRWLSGRHAGVGDPIEQPQFMQEDFELDVGQPGRARHARAVAQHLQDPLGVAS